MSSTPLPMIVVLGATGKQGGAVFRALCASNQFHVRGITRNPQSEAARKLLSGSNKHAEMVAADMTDGKSLEVAFTGAWAVFAFTIPPFWDPKKIHLTEDEQAKVAADAAIKAGVKVFVFSSLPDAHAISNGHHTVPHFTQKNRGEQYIRTLSFESAIFIYPGFFASNFLNGMRPKKNEKDGVYEFSNILRSDVPLPVIDIEEEFAAAVLEILRAPKKYNHQIIVTGTLYTYPQIVEAFTNGTGLPARYVQLPLEVGKNFGAEMNDMLQYFNDNGYYGGKSAISIVKSTDATEFFKKHAKQF